MLGKLLKFTFHFLRKRPKSSLSRFFQFVLGSISGFLKDITRPKLFCKKKNTQPSFLFQGCVQFRFGGEIGIRTPGCFHINGFQDRRFRPLSHLSILNCFSAIFYLKILCCIIYSFLQYSV